MTTFEALLHGSHHSVRDQEDFVDQWDAVVRANEWVKEFEIERSGGLGADQEGLCAEHENHTPSPVEQPERREVPDRIPVVSTGLHGDDEVEETDDGGDIFDRFQGGVQAVHHIEAAQEAATQEYPLIVITFGLAGEGKGRRDFHSEASLREVWNGIRRTWPEFHDHELYYVEPQPVLLRWPYIVFIVEERDMRSEGHLPVLLNFRFPRDMYNILWDFNTRAAYFNTAYNVLDNLEENGIEDVCQPHGLRICQVAVGLDQVRLHDRPRYTAGLLCDLNIDDYPDDWHQQLEVFPNFEQLATTVLMLRREGGLHGEQLTCSLQELRRDGEVHVHHFGVHWTQTQHPMNFLQAIRGAGATCDLIAMVWPQPPVEGHEHVWTFVGSERLYSPRSLNLMVIYQRDAGRIYTRPIVYDPDSTLASLLDSLTLPEWCEKGGGLHVYRLERPRHQRLSHGRRVDLITRNEEREDTTLMQFTATGQNLKKRIRDDNGALRVEEIIEHYQTESTDEDESDEQEEQQEVDYENGEHTREEGDPPDEPPDEDEEPQEDERSESNNRVQGMVFRKNHPVAHVWVHHEVYEDFVEETAEQLQLEPRDILAIHHLVPAPFDRPHIGFSALVRAIGDQYPDTTDCLVLLDVFIYNRANEPQEPALFRRVLDMPPLLTRRQLIEKAGLEPRCVARRNRCLVKVEGEPIPLQHTGPIFVQHGSYVVIRVPPFEEEDIQCEAMSLVQTKRARLRPTSAPTHMHLFRLSQHYRRLPVPERTEERLWLIEALREREDEITQGLRALHEVHDPPRELELTRESVYIAEGWGDRGGASHSDDQLILLDIEIKQSSRTWDRHTIRRVAWCRQRATRTSLLTMLRVHHLCIENELQGCHLFLNHGRIDDEIIRHIRDGDYLRVELFGKDRPWDTLSALKIFEEGERQRRIFGDSSEEAKGSTTSSHQAGHPHVLDRWCGGMSACDSDEPKDAPNDINEKRTILLDELIPGSGGRAINVHFCDGIQGQVVAIEVAVQQDIGQAVKTELQQYGLDDGPLAVIAGTTGNDCAVYFGGASRCNACFVQDEDPRRAIWSSCDHKPSHLEAMKLLYTWGYVRAYVIEVQDLGGGCYTVCYARGGYGQLSRPRQKDKELSISPPLETGRDGKIAENINWKQGSAGRCTMKTDMSPEILELLFGSGFGILRRDLEGLELPPWMEAEMQIAEDSDLAKYHHLRIYVDGSSDPNSRLCHPLEAECFGKLDAWAFVVVGVGHDDKEHFIGWTGQNVIYEELSAHFIGARTLGSASAEREALFWAGLWRMSQNTTLPTYFCYDSTTAGNFAAGLCGTPELTLQHILLRGVYQALESALDKRMALVHVHSHQGHLWNELADTAAKYVSNNAVYIPRQDVDLQLWRYRIPYLWMIFEKQAGLPDLHFDGFDVSPPAIPRPVAHRDEVPTATATETLRICVSAATVNVRSLSEGGRRSQGKTEYIMEQLKDLNFNLVGVQEARANEGMSRPPDGFLRYRSGSQKGNYGVELWVSQTQPIGYGKKEEIKLKAADVTVCHKDPRRLLARIEKGGVNILAFVIHAPHSGHDDAEISSWWTESTAILNRFNAGGRVIVLGDSNARSGRGDGKHVFEKDDGEGKNTGPFRDFLAQGDLCLPSTGHWHVGDSATWTTPNGVHEHRIDYTMVGCGHVGDIRHEVDLGDLNRDHRAVGLQMEWWICARPSTTTNDKWDPKFDRTKILDKETTEYIAADLTETSVPAWNVDIESHVAQHTRQPHNILEQRAPRKRGPAKKPFINDKIWTMRCSKRDLERRLRHTHRLVNRELLALCFGAWTGRTASTRCLHGWRVGAVRLAAGLRRGALELRRGLQAAKGQHVEELIDNLPESASAGDILRGLRPVIGTSNLRKRKGCSLPQIKDSENQICINKEEATNAWADYFTAMEGGERVSEEEQRVKWVQGLERLAQETLEIDINVCPNLVEMEEAFRRVKAGKAIGLDGIPPEMCRGCPRSVAKLSYTQMMKLVCHGQEDLLHKGGTLAVAFKRGDRDQCSSYRSLLISSHQGKTLHRALRQRQCGLYTAYQQAQQLGGRPRIPVSFASHLAKAFQRYQGSRGRSHGLLFLDLEEAYYRVLRPLAVGGVWTDEQIAAMASRLHLDGDTLAELHENLRRPSALVSAGVPHGHRHYIEAIHTDTFFQLPGQRDRSRTLAGTRPGDSFADVVFGYLWAKILRRLESELDRLGLLERFPAASAIGLASPINEGGEQQVLGPTWCDDLCILFSAGDAQGLVTKGGTVAGILIDLCKSHGMTPNLRKNKSEIMFTLKGKGSRHWRKICFDDWQGRLPVCCSDCVEWLHVVGTYQHLGGTLQHGGDQRREAARRMAVAHSAYGEHRRLLYNNRRFELSKRIGLFKTLVLPKAVFGMETWILETQRDRAQLHSRVMRLYRRLLHDRHDAHLSDEYIIAMTELPWPTVLMRSLRLRYLGLLYKAGDKALWSVLRCDTLWLELIKADLSWMYEQLKNSSRLIPPDEDIGAWEAIMKNHPGYWKRLIGRAVAHDTLQWKNAFVVDDFHREVVQCLQDAKIVNFVDPHDQTRKEDEGQYFGCLQCRTTCRNFAGEAAHMCKRHGHVNFVRSLISGPQCGACLKHYHTRARVQRHLMHSKKCRDELWRRGVRYDVHEGIGSTAVDKEEHEHQGLAPVLQAEGPQQTLRDTEMPDYNEDVVESIVVALDEMGGAEDIIPIVNHVVKKVEQMPVSWTEAQKALRHIAGCVDDNYAELLELPVTVLRQVIDQLLHPKTWSCFQKETGVQQKGKDLQRWQRVIVETHNARDDDVTHAPIPSSFGKHRVLVHAYSGRRRQGDLQCFLEEGAIPAGIVLHVVSLDIIVDRVYGNILDPDIRRFWIEGAKQKWVFGFVAGPPCETWSQARAHELDQGGSKSGKGPRVIRTGEYPWGLTSLGVKEIGDILMGFALVMLVVLYTTGGTGLLEHPARPKEEKAASIWRTPILEFLSHFPDFEIHRLLQGHFGAPSSKPTELLSLRTPTLARRLAASALTSRAPLGTSLGLDSQGNFRTSKLKEYPPSFCHAMACTILDSVDCVGMAQGQNPSSDFLSVCQALETTLYSDKMGHDYMRWN